MKVIFLDVDGVLNYRSSNTRCMGFLGIDDKRVGLLKEIVEKTNAKIVLCSTWKSGWQSQYKDEQDELANYLDRKLRRQKLYIFDKTIDDIENRGFGIKNWINQHNVENWIILDDEIFDDYEELGCLPHLVKTSFYDGGLKEEHVERAISILNGVWKL